MPAARDRDHHDRRRQRLAHIARHILADGVPQQELFERHRPPAGVEPQHLRAQPADRPRRDLQHRDPGGSTRHSA